MIPELRETKIVDARTCIIDLADGRRGLEAVMLRHFPLVERGLPTPGLDASLRNILVRIHLSYSKGNAAVKEAREIRPYELTGPAYAGWYDVGKILGGQPQSFAAHALCSGSMRLPHGVDPLTALQIERILAARGIKLLEST